MTFLQKILSYIIALIVGIMIGFGTCWLVKTCHKPVENVSLLAKEKQEIIQKARLGYIPEDSVWTLLQIAKTDSIHWTTKIDWIPKDSIVIRDSVVLIYMPIYTANDSIITILDSLGYVVRVGLSQGFLPLQKQFTSKLWLDSLGIPVTKGNSSTTGDEKFQLGVGAGARLNDAFVYGKISYYYLNNNWFYAKSSIKAEYNKKKEINPEFNTEIGVKLF